jgi:hypothetical protein
MKQIDQIGQMKRKPLEEAEIARMRLEREVLKDHPDHKRIHDLAQTLGINLTALQQKARQLRTPRVVTTEARPATTLRTARVPLRPAVGH